jgi:hypothetical protein
MRRLIPLLLLLISTTVFSQQDKNRYVNLSGSFDPNTAFSLWDNPRMEEDYKGMDFDFEIGASDRNIYVYLFYGFFDAADYQNYGVGTDYIIFDNHNFEFKAGPAVSVIMRKQMFGSNLDQVGWGSALGYHLRGVGSLRLNDVIALIGRVQYQRRPDLNRGIMEGSVGIAIRFHRKI